ncbi:response regulator transcription factor [Oleispirillum naphthae]|uniref:response regulator transcription factor n=1 Tax=Oleispirillum naphthae TaxID=2838853 RepID=UPI00308226F5
MATLLLIDDDRELAAMLTEYLAAEGFTVSARHTAQAGIAAALSGGFAAVILDVMLPDRTGIDALKTIRAESRIPILMLTARGDDVDRVLGLEMGADDYLPKPFLPRELVARIRAVLRRTAEPAAAGPLLHGGLSLDAPRREAALDGRPLDLTATEFNLLEILLRERPRVVTKDELSMRVLGHPRRPYDRSIDVHVSNIRQKLGTVAIETVRGVGYRMGDA